MLTMGISLFPIFHFGSMQTFKERHPRSWIPPRLRDFVLPHAILLDTFRPCVRGGGVHLIKNASERNSDLEFRHLVHHFFHLFVCCYEPRGDKHGLATMRHRRSLMLIRKPHKFLKLPVRGLHCEII